MSGRPERHEPEEDATDEDALERADVAPEDLPSMNEVSPSAGTVGSPATSGLVEPGIASTEQADVAEASAADDEPRQGD